MTSAGLRSAQAAIDGARGAVERLDETRHPEDNAADLIEGWNGAQAALLALAGVATVSDNALVGEVRKRGFLSLQDAHSLVAFSAAAERARDGVYQPNAEDLAAARAGFHLLEAALGRAPATDEPPTPPRQTVPPEPPPPSPWNPGIPLGPIVPPARPPSGSLLARGVVIVAVLAIIAVAGYYVVQFRSRSGHLERGIAAYASGNRATAKTEFGAATSRDPKSALPHIYLGRIARDEGDPIAAARHLDSAVTREPNNALALREMGAHLEGPMTQHNVVAEIRGSEKPDEIVLIGAHLDSWDVGTGAQDDGSGVVHVIGAMRQIQALGTAPRRTIRGVLFANEERGLSGGKAYFDAHGKEIHVAAVESDLGAGRPLSWSVTANEAQAAYFQAAALPIGLPVSVDGGGGADIGPLGEAGVMVAGLLPDDTHYFDVHHTEADTVDKVDPVMLDEGVAQIAALAWRLADAP